jgi:hypothetical protein
LFARAGPALLALRLAPTDSESIAGSEHRLWVNRDSDYERRLARAIICHISRRRPRLDQDRVQDGRAIEINFLEDSEGQLTSDRSLSGSIKWRSFRLDQIDEPLDRPRRPRSQGRVPTGGPPPKTCWRSSSHSRVGLRPMRPSGPTSSRTPPSPPSLPASTDGVFSTQSTFICRPKRSVLLPTTKTCFCAPSNQGDPRPILAIVKGRQ